MGPYKTFEESERDKMDMADAMIRKLSYSDEQADNPVSNLMKAVAKTGLDMFEPIRNMQGEISGPPMFPAGLIQIPGKTLTIGKRTVQDLLEKMKAGTVPYRGGTASGGFSGHGLYYNDKPPITTIIPRTKDVPLDVYSGLHPNRFQTHADKGAQRFTAGALRGEAPDVQYLRGRVHYPLAREDALEQTYQGQQIGGRHPVVHGMSEEMDTFTPTAINPPESQRAMTPQALEMVSEIQPETNISGQGLQIPPKKPSVEPSLLRYYAPEHGILSGLSPRFASLNEEQLTSVPYWLRNALIREPKIISVVDDIQNAIEAGLLGDPQGVGAVSWRIGMHDNYTPAERPYSWNGMAMRTQVKERTKNLPNGPIDIGDPHTAGYDLQKFYEGFADAFNIPRSTPRVTPVPAAPVPVPAGPTSKVEYDQQRLAEAMYNATRQDVLSRGNIPIFGRSGATFARGGGGSMITDANHQVVPAPFVRDAYENIPRKMGMIPENVRVQSLPGSALDANLSSWAPHMDAATMAENPGGINPIARLMLDQGGFI